MNPEDEVFFLACGVLPYFRENEIRRMFAGMALRFPRVVIVFDAPSKLFRWVTNWSVLRGSGMGRDALMKWGVSAAGDLAKWDRRIQVLDEYPWFSRIEMDARWSKSIVNTMKWTNRLRALNIFHLRFQPG
jgi:O-methyltransferase involved in polyketide biosynthesis